MRVVFLNKKKKKINREVEIFLCGPHKNITPKRGVRRENLQVFHKLSVPFDVPEHTI